jgi:hypothetical protein
VDRPGASSLRPGPWAGRSAGRLVGRSLGCGVRKVRADPAGTGP